MTIDDWINGLKSHLTQQPSKMLPFTSCETSRPDLYVSVCENFTHRHTYIPSFIRLSGLIPTCLLFLSTSALIEVQAFLLIHCSLVFIPVLVGIIFHFSFLVPVNGTALLHFLTFLTIARKEPSGSGTGRASARLRASAICIIEGLFGIYQMYGSWRKFWEKDMMIIPHHDLG